LGSLGLFVKGRFLRVGVGEEVGPAGVINVVGEKWLVAGVINEVGEVGENFGFVEGNNECAWVADKLGTTGVGEKLGIVGGSNDGVDPRG